MAMVMTADMKLEVMLGAKNGNPKVDVPDMCRDCRNLSVSEFSGYPRMACDKGGYIDGSSCSGSCASFEQKKR